MTPELVKLSEEKAQLVEAIRNISWPDKQTFIDRKKVVDAEIERHIAAGRPPVEKSKRTIASSSPRTTKAANSTGADYPNTDIGNAEFFAARHGNKVRYDHDNNVWMVWAGHFWKQDTAGAVHDYVKEAIRERRVVATNLTDSEERRQALKWAVKSEDVARVKALMSLTSNEKAIRCVTEEWNRNPMLLAVQNGVIDLTTGQRHDGRPDDRISVVAPVTYDTSATCPRWEQFITEIFASNPDIAPYMQRVIGYMLTGDVSEQVFWIWHGQGSNGKSTLGEVILKLLGPLAGTMEFPSRRWSDSATDYKKAVLLGKRFVQSSEMRSGDVLNEHLVKTLVGGDTIDARHPYGRPFSFTPTAKFVMRVNSKPKIQDESHGMWRRIRLIPFAETFAVDTTLMPTLESELPGILNWAIKGCLDWQRAGLQEPACVLAATQEYKTEQNSFERFLADCCVIGPGEVKAADLCGAYLQWMIAEGTPQQDRLTTKEVGERAGQRFTKTHRNTGNVYQGVRLLSKERTAA